MSRKNEQRKAKRLDCLVPVDSKKNGLFGGVQTVDICQGGIGLISRRSIPVNERIVVEIELEPDGGPVLVMGQVKWVSKIKDSSKYRVGMSFSEELCAGSQQLLAKNLPA